MWAIVSFASGEGQEAGRKRAPSPKRPANGYTQTPSAYRRRAHSCIAMPAATTRGREWFTPYNGIPSTSSAAESTSSGKPNRSLPNANTTSGGNAATDATDRRAWSFSNAHRGRPRT